jgi:exonuclease III
MAFRKKAQFILAEKPDILIVPECEHPDKLKFDTNVEIPTDYFWYGTNLNKGLGVFSYGNYKFELLKIHDPEIKTILPLKVTGGECDFILFAIWANNPQDKAGAYVEQVYKAINYYSQLITSERTILIGDFNSNKIWDRKSRKGNHSTVVDDLFKKEIHSVYHHYFKQEQGLEEHPTLFMYRHLDKPYHIDYCFASVDLINKLSSVEIGSYNDWIALSDHSPVIVDFVF